MRAFKIFQFLFLLLLLGTLTTKIASAQQEGALVKMSPDSSKTSAIEILPYGILVGELDSRLWNYPYNGLFLSRDLGQSWAKIGGLDERGITDIAYDKNSKIIYAATYYIVNDQAGLFMSSDQGQTFQHIGHGFSNSNVEISNGNIIIGSYNHGLWVSQDNGQTWIQKLGNDNGWTGPQVVNITARDNLVFASTTTRIFRSEDSGLTWSEIPQLEGEQIHTFLITENVVLAGCRNDRGIFRSTDNGQTWEWLASWGHFPAGDMVSFNNELYVQKVDTIDYNYYFYKTLDDGDSWLPTNLDPGIRMKDIKLLNSYPSYFFVSTEVDGIHRYAIPTQQPIQNNFLNIPWSYADQDELTNKITAYFDHQYPLTSYAFHQEPEDVQDSTLTFLGYKKDSQDYYYSSHNGADFALPFGQEVLAAASGWANYYHCDWCGHSIKISHLNGYQTVYMHLQRDGLISDSASNSVWVEQGTAIGKVGVTGRTTGPHLHFGVLKDTDSDGVFNDYPDGLVDPFSWLDPYIKDPWPNYNWRDALGYHRGTESEYLWNYETEIRREYIQDTNNKMVLGNKTITFSLDDLQDNFFTAIAANYLKPRLPFSQMDLEYIEGTSLTLTAKDHFSDGLLQGSATFTVEFDLSELDLKNVLSDTLKVYVWDKIKQKWEPLPTIYDQISKKLSAQTNHMSHFAVFGQKMYPESPSSFLLIEGEIAKNWYLEHPTILILAQDYSGLGIEAVYFSKNDGLDWEIYTEPFMLESEGATNLLFRAEDATGNLEPTNSHVVKIDTQGLWKDKAIVRRTSFSVSN